MNDHSKYHLIQQRNRQEPPHLHQPAQRYLIDVAENKLFKALHKYPPFEPKVFDDAVEVSRAVAAESSEDWIESVAETRASEELVSKQ